MLQDLKISRIVNCTHNIPNFHEGKFEYYSFPIGKWRQYCEEDNENVLRNFIQGYITFIEESLDKSETETMKLNFLQNCNCQGRMCSFTASPGLTGPGQPECSASCISRG